MIQFAAQYAPLLAAQLVLLFVVIWLVAPEPVQ